MIPGRSARSCPCMLGDALTRGVLPAAGSTLAIDTSIEWVVQIDQQDF